jgi:hypothetical protein
VALLTATPCATWWRSANAASKAGTSGPCVRNSERSTAVTAAMSLSSMLWQL